MMIDRIHAEKGGMAVREHEELDKVLNAMNGYLDHVSQEQEVKK